jgi:hypothetical protein
MSQPDRRRLRFLWIGLVTWILVIINAVRLIRNAPYQVLVIAGVVDFLTVGAFIIAIRREYRKNE